MPESKAKTGDPMVVVLTGGIASGKSEVSAIFARLGVPIVDTDVIARSIVRPGSAALAKIVAAFGPKALNSEGMLDRARMRREIFADEEKRLLLESILHPEILAEAQKQIERTGFPYCVFVVPLFDRTSYTGRVDRVVVVDAEEAAQIARVRARDDVGEADARAVLRAQVNRASRLALADDVIDNSGSINDLREQVEALHRRYLEMAERSPPTGEKH